MEGERIKNFCYFCHMKEIRISDTVASAAPGLQVIVMEADVENKPTSDELWEQVCAEAARIRATYEMSEVNKRPAIAATRAAYKALGKDPNRYRPSSESLCRRAVKGLDLYRIDSVVDVINLLSMKTGHSIGGFDADKIDGDVLTLGRGEAGEPYEGIGRGMLNIEGMPVYRDATGGVGTPTSDNERTKLTPDTRRLLMLVNAYGGEMPPEEVEATAHELLEKYCGAKNISCHVVTASAELHPEK